MTSTVYAMQVDQAIQGMGICDSVEAIAEMFDFGDEFIIKGNRDYNGYISSDNEEIIEIFTDDWMDYEDRIENIEQYVNRIFSDDEIEVFEKMFDEFEDDVPTILTAVTGKEWESGTIRGYSQGEWQNIYYVKDRFSKNTIYTIEAYYFNTGSEWMIFMPETKINDVSELENMDCEFTTYCTDWLDDDIRQHIADECNVNPADVVLIVIDGYVQMPKYEMRISEAA